MNEKSIRRIIGMVVRGTESYEGAVQKLLKASRKTVRRRTARTTKQRPQAESKTNYWTISASGLR